VVSESKGSRRGGFLWCGQQLRAWDDERRNILLFPQGNSNGQANDMVSVYLNYGDPKQAKDGWHVCAQFALAISNPHDPTIFIQSRTCDVFGCRSGSRQLTYNGFTPQRLIIGSTTRSRTGVSHDLWSSESSSYLESGADRLSRMTRPRLRLLCGYSGILPGSSGTISKSLSFVFRLFWTRLLTVLDPATTPRRRPDMSDSKTKAPRAT
jgi:hypothetical protein